MTVKVWVRAYTPDINVADPDDSGAVPDFGNLLGGVFCLLNAAADDAGVSSEMNHGAGLRAADGACTARDE